jgi:hypothetical protein
MVACLLSLCASSPLTAGGARAATRARGQTAGATLSATHSSDGSWQNQPTMGSQGGALLPLAAGLRLSGSQARWGCRSIPLAGRGRCEQKSSDGAFFQDQVACLDYTLMKKSVRNGFAEDARILHHLEWEHHSLLVLLSGCEVGRDETPCVNPCHKIIPKRRL